MVLGLLLSLGSAGCLTMSTPDPFAGRSGEFCSRVKTIAMMPAAPVSGLTHGAAISARYEDLVKEQLTQAGFEVVASDKYKEILDQAKSEVGALFDPLTGQPNKENIQRANSNALERFSKKYPTDAKAYMGVVNIKANWRQNEAEWDGVMEPSSGEAGWRGCMTAGNRYGTIGALSFSILLLDPTDQPYYSNRGGIQLLSHVNESNFVDVPVKDLFVNPSNDVQAVTIALKPLLRSVEAAKADPLAAGIAAPSPAP
ncbi:MAG TPA: hypothetical protein DCZ95_17750 [Verrucomicrobia bacterium]|nr:hypothetical protein [Verrucomicrobiota bacterium]